MVGIISAIGGIGFFLLGMNLMTDGLKAIAGDSLRNLLNRFTGGTLSAITTGAVITLLVQSSTATSLMTIGFVSAGMLTFVQATGVIFGANLGTTSTGWMVAFIFAPFIKQFTRGISKLVPEKKSAITQHLDKSILPIPAVATETAMRAMKEATKETLTATGGKFESLSSGLPISHAEVEMFNKKLETI